MSVNSQRRLGGSKIMQIIRTGF